MARNLIPTDTRGLPEDHIADGVPGILRQQPAIHCRPRTGPIHSTLIGVGIALT